MQSDAIQTLFGSYDEKNVTSFKSFIILSFAKSHMFSVAPHAGRISLSRFDYYKEKNETIDINFV